MSDLPNALSLDETEALLQELAEVASPSLLADAAPVLEAPPAPPSPEPAPSPAEEAQPFALGGGRHATLRMPALERIGEKLVRGLRCVIEPFARARTQVTRAALEVRQYDEWVADLPFFVAISHYRAPAMQGGFLVLVEPEFIAGLVESFYGGSINGRPVKRSEFTVSEERLLARFVDQAVALLAEAWSDVADLQPALVRREHNAGHINLVRADDPVVIQSFAVQAGAARAATISFVYPHAMLRPVEETVATRGADHHRNGADEIWRQRLGHALEEVTVPVRSVLARPEISLSQLMALKPGDIIPVQLAPLAPLLAGSRQLGLGTLGEQDGRAALMIQHMEPR